MDIKDKIIIFANTFLGFTFASIVIDAYGTNLDQHVNILLGIVSLFYFYIGYRHYNITKDMDKKEE